MDNVTKCGPSHEINYLKPSGHYMYRQFNIQQFYVKRNCVFCVDLRKKLWLFPYTALTDWFL